MRVYLNAINGVADAMVSMYMSKRTWSREKEVHLRDLCHKVLDSSGRVKQGVPRDVKDEFDMLLNKVLKIGSKHITLLRFIDLSFTVEGLHRGAQDDFDAHAKRLENRIVRSSTRLADFNGCEKSEWYDGKVLHIQDLAEKLNLPKEVDVDGEAFVLYGSGYLRKDLLGDKDAQRGLYTLDIPSNFIFKVNLTEFSHIVKERDKNSFASPELRLAVEQMKGLLEAEYPQICESYLYSILN